MSADQTEPVTEKESPVPDHLYNGCIFAAIVNAVSLRRYPDFDFEHSWEGLTSSRPILAQFLTPDYWRSKALTEPQSFSVENLARMQKGRGPKDEVGDTIELHHRIPLSRGGTNDPDNFVEMSRREHRLGRNLRKNHPSIFP
jgi:hypothetical protein